MQWKTEQSALKLRCPKKAVKSYGSRNLLEVFVTYLLM